MWTGLSTTHGVMLGILTFQGLRDPGLGYETRALGIADRMGRCTDRLDPL
jgi:hypothetical protein